jgi:hypothetical protein
MNTEERLERAVEARFVLDNPAYREAVEKFLRDIRSLRLALSPRDTDGATKLVLMEQAVEKARRLMETYLEDGDMARKELEREVRPGPIGRLNRAFRRGQAI